MVVHNGVTLMHYASEHYDPVKAHEYYLKTRELAAKNPAMSKTQKEVWNVAKDDISTKQKVETETAQTDQEARLVNLRKSAEDSRDRILASLKSALEKVKVDTPIPRDASPKLRAFLLKQQKANSEKARKDSASQLNKMGRALQGEIAQAREAYAAATKARSEKYKAMNATEAANIRTQVQ